MKRNSLTERIIGCAIEVHRHLGPGLLESTYEQCLAYELTMNDLPVSRQLPLPVHYKGKQLDCGYRIDLLVADRVILELKSTDEISNLHRAQILTYMKLAKIDVGLLINFNTGRLVDGLQRFRL